MLSSIASFIETWSLLTTTSKPLALSKHLMLKTLENLNQQLYQLSFFETLQISLFHIPRLHLNLYNTWHTKNHILNGMLVNAFLVSIISHIVIIFSLMTYKSHAQVELEFSLYSIDCCNHWSFVNIWIFIVTSYVDSHQFQSLQQVLLSTMNLCTKPLQEFKAIAISSCRH